MHRQPADAEDVPEIGENAAVEQRNIPTTETADRPMSRKAARQLLKTPMAPGLASAAFLLMYCM